MPTSSLFAIPPHLFLVVASILFGIGVVGVLLRKNALLSLMSIELMLNAANITLVTFSKMHSTQSGSSHMEGQVFAFLSIAIAAAEAAVGLAIVVGVFRNKKSTNLNDLQLMKY